MRNRRRATAQQSSQRRSDQKRTRNVGGNPKDEVQELGGNVTLRELDRPHAMCPQGVVHEHGEADTWKLEKVDKCKQTLEGVEKVTWVTRS